jgi:hypothetical protein
MAILTRDRIEPLLQAKSEPCLSLYMPIDRREPGIDPSPVRFRGALEEAERLLSDRYSARETRALLDPVAALVGGEFWRHQADGLAILRSPDVLEQFRLPLRVPNLVVVAESFHVRPLIRCLNSNERYFVVALGESRAAVFEGSLASLTPAEVPGLPEDGSAYSGKRRRKAAPGARTLPGRGDVGGARPGEGAGPSPEHDLASYFRAVDRALGRSLRHEAAPVVLAGVEPHVMIYRSVSRLKGLAGRAANVGADVATAEELHALVRPIAEAVLREIEERLLERYRRAADRGRSSDRLEDIVGKARRGRVRRLFLPLGVRVWGTVDPLTGHIERTNTQQGSRDDDLLDDVAESVFLHGGEVVTLPPERIPGGREAVAELR